MLVILSYDSGVPKPFRGPLFTTTTWGRIANTCAGAPERSPKKPWWVAWYKVTVPSLFTGQARAISLSQVRSPTSRNFHLPEVSRNPAHREFSVLSGSFCFASFHSGLGP